MFPTIDKRRTGIQLRKMMDERGLTVKDIQKYLCLGSVQSVYHWLNGISLPTIDNLYALSELFQIPVDEMLCGNRQRENMCGGRKRERMSENRQQDVLYEIGHPFCSGKEKPQYKRLWAYYDKMSDSSAA